MKTNSKLLTILTFLYIYLPVCIFLIGFTKPWVWIITIGVCSYAVFVMYKDFRADDVLVASPVITWKMCVVAFLIIVLTCVILGFGGIFQQPGDWPKHNAVLHDLVNKDWPVYYTEHEQSMLTYYLGQYLVAGLLGKIVMHVIGSPESGFSMANGAMAVWGIIGVMLVYIGLVRVTRSNTWRKQFRCLLIMIFFSGALPLVQMITSGIYGEDMYSLGSHHWLMFSGISLQYRSNLVMLRWVYPQVIVGWLVSIYLYEHRENVRDFVILIAPILLYGTFSVVFLAITAIGTAVFYFVKAENKKGYLKRLFGITNITAFLTLGAVEILYFLGYMQVEKPSFLAFHLAEFDIKSIWGILIFELFMFGGYCICVRKEQKGNPIYFMTCCLLMIIPFFKMGLYNDFVMCSSIPGLFFVMIFVIQYLNLEQETRAYGFRAGIIAFCIFIGAWYPTMEIKEIVHAYSENSSDTLMDYFGTLERYTDRSSDDAKDLVYNYYTYDLEGKLFYEVLARKKIGE